MKANILSLAILVAALCFFLPRYLHQPWPPQRIAGALIALTSLSFIAAARMQLGRAFSIRAKATCLVTTGLSGDDDQVQILTGLAPGDTIVTSGQFLMDVESRTNEATQKFLNPTAP